MATAANPPPAPTKDGETLDCSMSWFRKTVTLRDWWLIKLDEEAQGKRLGVAGFSFGENKVRRFFKSAPIVKRFDEFAVETADRIVVVLQGLINEVRTVLNGFSSQILDRFLFGFPFDWKELADDCLKEMIDPGTGVNKASNSSDLNESTTNTGLAVGKDTHDGNASRSLACSSSDVVMDTFLKDINYPPLTSCSTKAVNLAKESPVLLEKPPDNIVGESSHKTVLHETSRKTKMSQRNGDGLESGSSLLLDPNDVTIQKDDMLGSPSIESSYILERMDYSKKDDKFVDATKSGLEVDVPCQSNVEGNILVATDPNCGSSKCAKDLKDDMIQKLRLRSPPAGKSHSMKKNAISHSGISVVTRSPASTHEKVTPPKVVTRSSLKRLKDGKAQNSSSKAYTNQKDKKSLSLPNKHFNSVKRKKDSSTGQSNPAEVNVVEAMLRAGRTLRRSSTHTRSHDEKGKAASEGNPSRKKAKRKIEFDVDVTPKKRQREIKTCILSADSLTFKRSRSGRRLLPTLHFWRNQIPVYDAERNFTGIREEVDA